MREIPLGKNPDLGVGSSAQGVVSTSGVSLALPSTMGVFPGFIFALCISVYISKK